jgi:ferric-dicitrate binding protein FerR (iron transport regulator)
MKTLEQKYRSDELSPKELKTLREAVNTMTDKDIEQSIQNDWMNEDQDISGVDDERMERIKQQIDVRLGFRRSARLIFIRVMQAAAAVLLLLLASTTVYFYHETKALESEVVVFSTQKGERANIVLPDGSTVALNAESELTYSPKLYRQSERRILFYGEAYFQVSSDKSHPFRIEAKDLTVTVLGTSFNLLARKDDDKAELALESGSVRFCSVMTGDNVVLEPNQRAVLNRKNGKITVLKSADVHTASAWQRGELIFRNTPLADVLNTVRETYGVSIETDCRDCLTDLFTGTIPASNLNEALDIIEKTYHFTATLQNSKVQLTARE